MDEHISHIQKSGIDSSHWKASQCEISTQFTWESTHVEWGTSMRNETKLDFIEGNWRVKSGSRNTSGLEHSSTWVEGMTMSYSDNWLVDFSSKSLQWVQILEIISQLIELLLLLLVQECSEICTIWEMLFLSTTHQYDFHFIILMESCEETLKILNIVRGECIESVLSIHFKDTNVLLVASIIIQLYKYNHYCNLECKFGC